MSGEVSFSFHISSKKNAIKTIDQLKRVALHNDRSYKTGEYNRDLIEHIRGTDNTYHDVKEVYKVFEPAKDSYNRMQKREDRKIKNYMKHVSDSRNDVAVEIIIQLGDKDFWADKTLEERKKVKPLLEQQVAKLEELMPDFIIANAVIHWDEKSPHVQVVGVPVYKKEKTLAKKKEEGKSDKKSVIRGMMWECVKTKLFTEDSLATLQAELHQLANEQVVGIKFKNKDGSSEEMTVKEKEIGRNNDIPKELMTPFKKLEANIKRAARKRSAEEEKQRKEKFEQELNEQRQVAEQLRLDAERSAAEQSERLAQEAQQHAEQLRQLREKEEKEIQKKKEKEEREAEERREVELKKLYDIKQQQAAAAQQAAEEARHREEETEKQIEAGKLRLEGANKVKAFVHDIENILPAESMFGSSVSLKKSEWDEWLANFNELAEDNIKLQKEPALLKAENKQLKEDNEKKDRQIKELRQLRSQDQKAFSEKVVELQNTISERDKTIKHQNDIITYLEDRIKRFKKYVCSAVVSCGVKINRLLQATIGDRVEAATERSYLQEIGQNERLDNVTLTVEADALGMYAIAESGKMQRKITGENFDAIISEKFENLKGGQFFELDSLIMSEGKANMRMSKTVNDCENEEVRGGMVLRSGIKDRLREQEEQEKGKGDDFER